MKNKMKKLLSQQGSTLVELLMYMGIFSLLLVSLFQILTSVLASQAATQGTSHVEEDGKFLLARLSYDIQRAQTIVIPATIGSSGNSLKLTISGVTYSYSLNNSNLVLTNNTETNALLNGYDTTVSNLTFSRLGNTNGKPVITTSFTVTSKTPQQSGIETRTFQTIIGTR